MDIFDQYLFDELTAQYAQPDLSSDDYEELFMRFGNIAHLDEVQPYLLTMRYFGLGTVAEKNAVITELKAKVSEEDYILKGLYFDLILSENPNDSTAITGLRNMVKAGYTNIYTKDKSNIHDVCADADFVYDNTETIYEVVCPICDETVSFDRNTYSNGSIVCPNCGEILEFSIEDEDTSENSDSIEADTDNDEVSVDYMIFECNGYSGLYFTAGDIDYLAAKVFIKPIKGKKHIKVRSQIYLGDEPFSKVFSNEYDITPETRWFKTQGWGNTNYNCYRNNTYRWIIEIDGETTFSQEFRMYNGKMNKTGPRVNDVKLFASKASGALEKDRDSYRTIFDSSTLEYIYFKFLINEPGENMNVQAFIKITYLEDNSVFWDDYIVQPLDDNTIAFWTGVGYRKAGNWKTGLYQYSAYIGNRSKYEGTFTVC